MKIKQKVLAATLASLGLLSVAQAADPSATVVWSGVVPATQGDGSTIITGFNGSETALSGTINASADGTFTSSSVVLEIRDGVSGTVGELHAGGATWQVKSTSLTYDGQGVANANLIVNVDNNPVTLNTDAATGAQTISISVAQDADLTADNVGGTSVQASATLVADAA